MSETAKRAQVWSYGGGVQSVAIAVLVAEGKLPRPDVALMADTGREMAHSWAYYEARVRPLLAPLGLDVELVAHDYATVDLYGKNGDLLIPAYTAPGDGTPATGKLPTFCSGEWKRRVIRRRLREMGYGPTRPVEMWLGYSTDEVFDRATPSGTRWIRHAYPLAMVAGVDRRTCHALIARAGLHIAPRSRCWMCPHQRDEEWREVRESPAEWAAAVDLDEAIRARHPGVYLHRSGLPLAVANIDTPIQGDGPLFACAASGCFT